MSTVKIVKEHFKKILSNLKVNKFVGLFLVVFGFIGIITPFTPWGFLFFVGLEIMGVRLLFVDKFKKKFMEWKRLLKRNKNL